MKTCTHCRMEVPTSANKCPYCLENPNDGFEFIHFIISCLMIGALAWIAFKIIF
jgi:hypothetical protein